MAKRKGISPAIHSLARQLKKVLDGEKVLSDLPALETRVASMEARIKDAPTSRTAQFADACLASEIAGLRDEVAVQGSRVARLEAWASGIAGLPPWKDK